MSWSDEQIQKTRILWISPWFRSLSSEYLELLQKSGDFECFLITSANHLAGDGKTFSRYISLDNADSSLSNLRKSLSRVRKQISKFQPDLILVDYSNSFFWFLVSFLSSLGWKRGFVFHDPIPHNGGRSPSLRLAIARGIMLSTGRIFVVFSNYGRTKLKSHSKATVLVLPLIPEIRLQAIKKTNRALTPKIGLLGRWSEYKGFENGIEIFKHLRNKFLLNAELHLWCSGVPEEFTDSSPGVFWKSRNRHEWSDLIRGLSELSVVLLPYSEASQSGVQVLANSLGVPTLCSPVGALSEYQDPLLPCLQIETELWAETIVEVVNNWERYSTSALNWNLAVCNKTKVVDVFRAYASTMM